MWSELHGVDGSHGGCLGKAEVADEGEGFDSVDEGFQRPLAPLRGFPNKFTFVLLDPVRVVCRDFALLWGRGGGEVR